MVNAWKSRNSADMVTRWFSNLGTKEEAKRAGDSHKRSFMNMQDENSRSEMSNREGIMRC